MKRSIAYAGLAAVLLCVTLLTQPATAAPLIYNYDQNWLYDPATGLFWQTQQIPSSTFVPAAGTIANETQLAQLGTDAGLPGFTSSGNPDRAYSTAVANLLSFFQSDTPAATQSTITLSEVYFLGPYATPDNFEYEYYTYQPVAGGLWRLSTTTTLGAYGPDAPCVDGPPCPATEPAFVVSTVQPVDLPDSVGLLIAGISMLGWWSQVNAKQRRASPRPSANR